MPKTFKGVMAFAVVSVLCGIVLSLWLGQMPMSDVLVGHVALRIALIWGCCYMAESARRYWHGEDLVGIYDREMAAHFAEQQRREGARRIWSKLPLRQRLAPFLALPPWKSGVDPFEAWLVANLPELA